MALVQAVPLPVLFVIISYPSNYNWRVVKDCCRWHMGEFGDKRVRAGKGGFNPPFNSTMAVMDVQLQGLLALELAALLPPCKLEGKISLYPPPPPPLNPRGPLRCQLDIWGEWVQASVPPIRVVLP